MIEKDGFISIIMAAYNAEKTIEMSICSAISQTYTHWELLVIDDCSTDDTPLIVSRIAQNDNRIKYVRNEVNSGVSRSRRRGLDLATGEWIAVLDSDDAWIEDKLEKQLILARTKDAEFVFTGSTFMDDSGTAIDWQLHVPDILTHSQLLKQNLISNSSVMVKRNLFERYFAEGDEMHEDYAIWLGITKSGYVAYGIDEPLLIYRIAKSSKTSNKLKSAKMQWNTYRYIRMNTFLAIFYMCWYTIKGFLKYRHLK